MRRHKVLIILIVLVVVSSFLFLMYGLNPNSYQYALSLRVPKLIAIALTGSGIALSSVIFQTVTNNRILTDASDDTPQSTSNNTDCNIQLSEPKNFKNLINDLYPM
ncbi:MAG: iron chelate uptake ABC transporter family permease subunit [Lactobacillus sp.]|nr:iron chelate uptake ABC transporter family permease subunit [Lactobacillus sp.]